MIVGCNESSLRGTETTMKWLPLLWRCTYQSLTNLVCSLNLPLHISSLPDHVPSALQTLFCSPDTNLKPDLHDCAQPSLKFVGLLRHLTGLMFTLSILRKGGHVITLWDKIKLKFVSFFAVMLPLKHVT